MPLQPQESDKVDNCVRRVEAREEEKEVQAETESKERERKREAAPPRLASPRLDLPCLALCLVLNSTQLQANAKNKRINA